MKQFMEYMPSDLMYQTERYLYWLEKFKFISNREQLAYYCSQHDIEERRKS